jgi:PPIC-type PPIASE domain
MREAPGCRLALCGVSLALIMGVTACGTGRHEPDRHASTSLAQSSTVAGRAGLFPRNSVAVSVGRQVITIAAVNRQLLEETSSEPASERLIPPSFTACIKQLKLAPRAVITNASQPSAAAPKRECEEKYHALRVRVLEKLILDAWVIGAARELGVAVDQFHGRSLSVSARVQFDAEAIRRTVKRNAGPVSPTRIATYYKAHGRLFFVTQRRDLEIVRTSTKAAAETAKRELASGESFASVVRGSSIQQPIFSNKGLVLGLVPGMYSEKALDHAIFAARVNVLSGPVKIVLGYYVFEVKRIHPARQKTFAQVRNTIRQQLPELIYRQALATFIASWRQRWSARTDCTVGYVVPKCRQARAANSENPYSLE